jgi:hypothetical protein
VIVCRSGRSAGARFGWKQSRHTHRLGRVEEPDVHEESVRRGAVDAERRAVSSGFVGHRPHVVAYVTLKVVASDWGTMQVWTFRKRTSLRFLSTVLNTGRRSVPQ